MFTGLVETMGAIKHIEREGSGKRLRVVYHNEADPLSLGESVAVDGCCLTVVERGDDWFDVQAGPETLVRTTLGIRQAGDLVNLERAVRPSDRLGGHIVQGHIDTTATLVDVRREGEWRFLSFAIEPRWTALMVEKGSIAIDGVSLTLMSVGPTDFQIMLIPHTLEVTTLGRRAPGSRVNVETDLLARHVQKLLGK
jgi:riboflavin synthase